jgi:hypothetical protein
VCVWVSVYLCVCVSVCLCVCVSVCRCVSVCHLEGAFSDEWFGPLGRDSEILAGRCTGFGPLDVSTSPTRNPTVENRPHEGDKQLGELGDVPFLDYVNNITGGVGVGASGLTSTLGPASRWGFACEG